MYFIRIVPIHPLRCLLNLLVPLTLRVVQRQILAYIIQNNNDLTGRIIPISDLLVDIVYCAFNVHQCHMNISVLVGVLRVLNNVISVNNTNEFAGFGELHLGATRIVYIIIDQRTLADGLIPNHKDLHMCVLEFALLSATVWPVKSTC